MTFLETIMKIIVPFDSSVSPPKRFWAALWCEPAAMQPEDPGSFWSALMLGSAVQPENPDAEFEAIRRGMVPGAPDVVLDRNQTAGGYSVSATIARAFASVGEWFVRREAAEREEQAAVMGGFDVLAEKARLRDALRTRHLRM
jgi:hypothetical protein